MNIRPICTETDVDSIAAIYNHYVLNTVITFDEEPYSRQSMTDKIENILSKRLPWLVLEVDGSIVGYAYAGTWRDRSAFRYTVETTVYLLPEQQGKGLGKRLYQSLLSHLKELDIKVAIGAVTLPNEPSERLHLALGMNKVAHFKDVGFKFKQWLDVGFYQITFQKD
jgi:phosphinothricin acetyltransferase